MWFSFIDVKNFSTKIKVCYYYFSTQLKDIKMEITNRTSAGLCEALFQEFDLLRAGMSDHHRAAAVAKLAVQIINTKRLEIDAAVFDKSGLKFSPLNLTTQGVRIGLPI
jgi:hypothetical protein